MKRDVYFGELKLYGEENEHTLAAANNYAASLNGLQRFKEARSLLHKWVPVARRVLGEVHDLTLKMRWNYAEALYKADGATRDDLREAVETLEDAERTARRVLGGAHPVTSAIVDELRHAREIHAIREELEANQAALDENLIARAALRASITRLYQLACALVALLVALVAAIVFKR